MNVKITVNDKVQVASPYNPSFPKRAKQLGGRWKAAEKLWEFDTRDETRVRELCREIYGTDGEPTATATVQVTIGYNAKNPVWLFGREIANRFGRDSEVTLGDGVILIGGAFPHSGGSRKYPELFNKSDQSVTLEVRDVPESLAINAVEADPEKFSIVGQAEIPETFNIILSENGLDKLYELRQKLKALTDVEIVGAALAFYAEHIKANS